MAFSVRLRYIFNIMGLIFYSLFQATLLPEVFNLLVSNLTNEIAYKIEEQVYKCRFNQVHKINVKLHASFDVIYF